MTYPIRSIVVGIAEPHEDDPALAAAVELARRSGAALHAVHAFAMPIPFVTTDAVQYTGAEALDVYTEEVRRSFATRMQELFREDPMVCHASPATAEDAILEVAERVQADVVVVGATHHGRIGQLLLGSTAQRVLRGSHCPVLVMRRWPPAGGRILATTDLSRASGTVYERGLEVADALFAGRATELEALLVVFPVPLAPPLTPPTLDRAAQEELASFLADRRPRGTAATPVIRFGSPGTEIPAEADRWQADLVVLGTHARSTPTRWLLGSVAEATLRGLRCNVLVVPPVPVPAEAQEAAAAPAHGPTRGGST